jgi:sugar fermentation stimulation protein A
MTVHTSASTCASDRAAAFAAMDFSEPLLEARLIRRYKRFLADVRFADGSVTTVHTPNTGSMLGCQDPGSRVWLRHCANPRRKYPLSWELVEAEGSVLVGLNTALPPWLVQEGITNGIVSELQGYGRVRREVPYGVERSRIDLLLEEGQGRDCYVEVKNVTAAVERGIALFPDAVSVRASKHLRELMAVAGGGERAVIFFVVQRGDVEELRPADQIDPEYGRMLRAARDAGVELIAYRARVTPESISLETRLPVVCP